MLFQPFWVLGRPNHSMMEYSLLSWAPTSYDSKALAQLVPKLERFLCNHQNCCGLAEIKL